MYSDIIEEIREYLIEKYKVHTIILYGSYAKGNYTEESDIDILCFYDGYDDIHDDSELFDKQLDVWIQPATNSIKVENYMHIIGGELLLDNRFIGSRLLEQIERKYENGPPIKTEEEKLHLKNWLKKMNNRTKRSDIEGNFRLHWMLKDSLEIYFNLKDLWYLGPKESLKWLYFNDETGYRLFSNAFKRESKTDDIDSLIEYIISL